MLFLVQINNLQQINIMYWQVQYIMHVNPRFLWTILSAELSIDG